ncbi:Transcription factor domain-containing protein [Madurella fahalii]|uniref:Transcription factor domain-containing protein n=1 Tax=Madurella fahalii TaxID=1157608 RepID=A0ABQ0G7P6_9PEZI
MLPSGSTTSGSGSPPRSLAKFGCVNCRKHHLKCDRVTPKCGRCLNAGIECLPPDIKIVKHKFKFTKKQKWVKTPKRLLWLDETNLVAQGVSSPESGPCEIESSWGSPSAVSEGSPQQTPQLSASIPRFPWGTPLATGQRSPTDRFMMSAPKWPLSDRGEAYLLRHFVEKLAVWLDLCDPNRSFEYIVPQRARSNPILLNAIFALSARHLCKTRAQDFDQCALYYNEACLEDLRSTVGCGWSENIFAAAIILQVVEEMNPPGDGKTKPSSALNQTGELPAKSLELKRKLREGHLCGVRTFVEQGNLTPGTLAAASFWVGLRQEIYRAVMVGRRVKLNLEHSLVDRSPLDEMLADDDYAWANRAVVHCADVLNFCYSPESVSTKRWDEGQLRRWAELERWNQEWLQKKPASFFPVYQSHDSEPFPEIWYHRSCQVIGLQHHLLAKLFLLDHGLEKGAPVAANGDSVDECIRSSVREICGIGLGNQWTPPSMFTACMAISAFGVKYFRAHPSELQAMLKILIDTHHDHGRPTKDVQSKVRRGMAAIDTGPLV